MGNLEGLKLTWGEWHMMVCGFGDGIGLRKAEQIPRLEDVGIPSVVDGQPCYRVDERDFHALLATEAWYYKIAFGIGRAMWALIIYLIIIGL